MKNRYSLIFLFLLFGFIFTACGSGGFRDDGDDDDSTGGSNGVTVRVSVDADGSDVDGLNADNNSYAASINSDGTKIAFESDATDLVAGDSNGVTDIFIRDLNTNKTTRVTVDADGSDADGLNADDISFAPSINSDGTKIAFASDATDLVAGDSNGVTDIFIRDLNTNKTTRVTVDANGSDADGLNADDISFAPSINSDGTKVAFASDATDLVAGDSNGVTDIFIHDLNTNKTTRVSVDANGSDADGLNADDISFAPSINFDGTKVAFASDATDLVAGDSNGVTDIFIRDLNTNKTTRVSVDADGLNADNNSLAPSINFDGTKIAFESYASDLVTGDLNNIRDVFVHDINSGTTTRVSVHSDGSQGNGSSNSPSISLNGSHITFDSSATTLVDEDTNGSSDIFVHTP